MKEKIILITSALLTILFVGCAKQPATPPKTTPNVVTTASIVNNSTAFEKAISNKGTWIIAITKDLAIDKDLVVDGEFKNRQKRY